MQFLQNVTPRIAIGAEMMYQQSPQIPGGAATVLSLCGRYSGKLNVLELKCYYERQILLKET